MLNRRLFIEGLAATSAGLILPKVKAEWPGKPQDAVWNYCTKKWELASKYDEYFASIIRFDSYRSLTNFSNVYYNDAQSIFMPTKSCTDTQKTLAIHLRQYYEFKHNKQPLSVDLVYLENKFHFGYIKSANYSNITTLGIPNICPSSAKCIMIKNLSNKMVIERNS